MGDRFFVDAAVLVVLDHTHDRHLILPIVGSDGVTSRILVGQKAFREQLVDDANVRRTGGVGVGKVTPCDDANSECVNKIRPGDIAANPS